MTESIATIVLVLTAGTLAFLVPFATHRTFLLLLARRTRTESREPWPEAELPVVTVQLPVYNERSVVSRLIDAVCSLDYPAHLLEIQVLDDSDDATSAIASERCAGWRARGIDVQHLRRGSRRGFKAGALAYGAELARGEFFLILDADFVTPRDLVRSLLAPMCDPALGMVQARWEHLNRDESWLTGAQAYLLDGHFAFEQGGRYRGGRFFNFNGTAGMWRRSCLVDGGGWQSDTLTEDLDLSYRAQMAGWRFAYLDDVSVPAELPATSAALEVQQRRWAQGGIQTARKILPGLLRGPWPLAVKLEAVVHLCGHLAHPLTLTLAVLLLPSALARRALGLDHLLWLDVAAFAACTVPFMAFYASAGRARGRATGTLLPEVLRTLVLGVGLSVPVTGAVFRGLRGTEDPFERTPKRGSLLRSAYPLPVRVADAGARFVLAGLMGAYLVASVMLGYWASVPFIVLFFSGYAALSLSRWSDARRESAAPQAGVVDDQQRGERRPEKEAKPERLRPASGLLVGAEPEVPQES